MFNLFSKMLRYNYLTEEHLKGFENYKYKAIDTSPLSVYVMHPFWNGVVKLVPRWVAPNLLTFVGFLLTVADFVLLSWYDYQFYASSASPALNATGVATAVLPRAPVPSWCWVTLSVFLFLAYTLDGIDGKQARRTGTSGPLGELFDHGLDSYSVFIIPVCLYCVMGRLDYSISVLRMYFVLWNIMFSFYTSHWEKYITGVLYLPWGYDFSMWLGCIVFLSAGACGTHVFKVTTLFGLTAANLFEISIYATGLLTNIPVSLYNVYLAWTEGRCKTRGACDALRPLWSVLVMFCVATWWVLSCDLLMQDPRAVYLLCGTLFSNLTCRLIVAQMSGVACETVCWLSWPVAAAAVLSWCRPALAAPALYLTLVFAVVAHVHYGTRVVQQLCGHYKIRCFKIGRRAD